MPKVANSVKRKLEEFVAQFPILRTDGKILFCKACNSLINADRLFNVEQHLKGKAHVSLAEKKTTIHKMWKESISVAPSSFGLDLCETLVSCDIPLYKLRSEKLNIFFNKYTTEKVPSETTIREKFVPQLADQLMEKIISAVQDKYLWISIDETSDSQKKKVVNVVLGVPMRRSQGRSSFYMCPWKSK